MLTNKFANKLIIKVKLLESMLEIHDTLIYEVELADLDELKYLRSYIRK